MENDFTITSQNIYICAEHRLHDFERHFEIMEKQKQEHEQQQEQEYMVVPQDVEEKKLATNQISQTHVQDEKIYTDVKKNQHEMFQKCYQPWSDKLKDVIENDKQDIEKNFCKMLSDKMLHKAKALIDNGISNPKLKYFFETKNGNYTLKRYENFISDGKFSPTLEGHFRVANTNVIWKEWDKFVVGLFNTAYGVDCCYEIKKMHLDDDHSIAFINFGIDL